MGEAKQLPGVKGKSLKKEREFWEQWFSNDPILWIDEDKQREVILNPGRLYTWFDKTYPVLGHITYTKRVYIEGLPRRIKGKIIAVTAIPRFKEKFEKVKEKLSYKELSKMGLLKAKPLGNYYELFESTGGYRVWTNAQEYDPITGNDKRKDKRISEGSARLSAPIGTIKDFAKRFGLTDSDSSPNNSASRIKRKSN